MTTPKASICEQEGSLAFAPDSLALIHCFLAVEWDTVFLFLALFAVKAEKAISSPAFKLSLMDEKMACRRCLMVNLGAGQWQCFDFLTTHTHAIGLSNLGAQH